MENDLMRFGIQLYADLASYAIPIAFVFGMSNVIVNTFFSVAFGSRMRIGGGKQ
jgi:hypothetical protein